MLATKTRLETQMDTMDVSDPHYERKILDLQRRYDHLYDKIAEADQDDPQQTNLWGKRLSPFTGI